MTRQCILHVILLALASATFGQDLPGDTYRPLALTGRHCIEISAGLLDWSSDGSVSIGSVESDVGSRGFVGSVAYSYWVRDYLAVGVTAGVMDVGVTASVRIGDINSKSAVVTPVLLGVTLYPRALAISESVLPFISASAGPYVGSSTNGVVSTGSVGGESVSEAVLGGRFRAGVDWFVANRFRLSLAAGYHVVADFDERIGSKDNYSGPEITMGFGVLIGNGRG